MIFGLQGHIGMRDGDHAIAMMFDTVELHSNCPFVPTNRKPSLSLAIAP